MMGVGGVARKTSMAHTIDMVGDLYGDLYGDLWGSCGVV